MQCQVDRIRAESAVQPARYWFTCAIRALIEFLTEWSVWIGFGQYVPVAILVEGMFEGIAVGRQLNIGA